MCPRVCVHVPAVGVAVLSLVFLYHFCFIILMHQQQLPLILIWSLRSKKIVQSLTQVPALLRPLLLPFLT